MKSDSKSERSEPRKSWSGKETERWRIEGSRSFSDIIFIDIRGLGDDGLWGLMGDVDGFGRMVSRGIFASNIQLRWVKLSCSLVDSFERVRVGEIEMSKDVRVVLIKLTAVQYQ
jgi:hypothetical protein